MAIVISIHTKHIFLKIFLKKFICKKPLIFPAKIITSKNRVVSMFKKWACNNEFQNDHSLLENYEKFYTILSKSKRGLEVQWSNQLKETLVCNFILFPAKNFSQKFLSYSVTP